MPRCDEECSCGGACQGPDGWPVTRSHSLMHVPCRHTITLRWWAYRCSKQNVQALSPMYPGIPGTHDKCLVQLWSCFLCVYDQGVRDRSQTVL